MKAEEQRTIMQNFISQVMAEKELTHWSIEHWVKSRQKTLVKAKVGQRVKPVGCWTGYWNMATLRVAPTRLVQMATRYPMMLAALLEDKKTWKNMLSPIWASIQPIKITKITPKLVCLKKLISKQKYPQRQKTVFVAMLMVRLQRKLMAQQLTILIPFILIICINFSSFSRTTRQRKTGSSRLKARGKIIVATVLMSISMNTEPQDWKGRYVQPELTLLSVVILMKALEIMSMTLKNPQGIMQQLAYVEFSSTFARIRILEMPLDVQNRNSLTSLTLNVAERWVQFAFLKDTAPSGRCSDADVDLREQSVSLLRYQYRLKRLSVTDSLGLTKIGGKPQSFVYSIGSMVLLTHTKAGQVVATLASKPQQPLVADL